MKRLALTIFGTVLLGTLLASSKTAALAAIYVAVAVALWKLTSKLDS